MTISKADTGRIARLARLSLDEREVESLTRDLATILDHMRELESAELEGVAPTGGISEHPAPFRADVPGADPLRLPLGELAPRLEEGFFAVPRLAALDADALEEERVPGGEP